MMKQDEIFMHQALQMARMGQYSARPNPLVGAVLVQNGQIVAKAFHAQAGKGHAEKELFSQYEGAMEDATLYVTLEPCSHFGRTPPCADEIIARKIKRVVIATEDPNPKVNGKGIQGLKDAGVDVSVGVLRAEAISQNAGFFLRMIENRPLVRAKVAMSLDGKVAMHSGESQWITDVPAREAGHLWRARSGALLTSCETVIKDDCQLTVRHPALPSLLPEQIDFQPPLKVILDKTLQTPPSAKIFKHTEVLIAVSSAVSEQKRKHFLSQLPAFHQVKIVEFPLESNHIAFGAVLHYLAELEINDVMIEAGPKLLTGLLQAKQIDELLLYIAPSLMGVNTLAMQSLEFSSLSEVLRGDFYDVKTVGKDIEARMLISDWAKTNNPTIKNTQEFVCSFIP